MPSRGRRELTDEERILWNRIASSAVPLRGRARTGPPAPADEPAAPAAPAAEATPSPASSLPGRPVVPRAPASPPALDRPTRQKLSRGRLAIEGTVDLHGLTQHEAHRLLLSFLSRAHADGVRHVVVITGKGGTGERGVLRRVVPDWFATPPFRQFVSGFSDAARGHGGQGALYVRIKRGERP